MRPEDAARMVAAQYRMDARLLSYDGSPEEIALAGGIADAFEKFADRLSE